MLIALKHGIQDAATRNSEIKKKTVHSAILSPFVET